MRSASLTRIRLTDIKDHTGCASSAAYLQRIMTAPLNQTPHYNRPHGWPVESMAVFAIYSLIHVSKLTQHKDTHRLPLTHNRLQLTKNQLTKQPQGGPSPTYVRTCMHTTSGLRLATSFMIRGRRWAHDRHQGGVCG